MSAQQAPVADLPVPAPTKPTESPAPVEVPRDLLAEKQKEQERERSAAASKANKFAARKQLAPTPPKPSPEFETLLFSAASNNPLQELKNLSFSTFIPFFGTAFYLLNFMDHTMASTRRFTDNCMGWVPPISQMYISILLYVQIVRAMDAAGQIAPGSELANFLKTFETTYPLNGLWIPGPLVALFRNVSAFWPSSDDQFGNVTPTLPASPGWTATSNARLANYNGSTAVNYCLPSISYFISRFHSVTNAANAANMTQAIFSNRLDGPRYVSSLFRKNVDNSANEQWIMISPGAKFAYPDNLQLWQNAFARRDTLSIPPNLNLGTTNTSVLTDEWTAYFRFSQNLNEHVWFGPVSAVMALYSKFFRGSQSLEDVEPNCSAAPAVKMRFATGNNLLGVPTFTAAAGNGDSQERGNTNAAAHYVLSSSAIIRANARVALKDVPAANIYASLTYNINCYNSAEQQVAMRQGPFWTLGPDVLGRDNVETTSGVLPIVLRDYHSPIALS